MLVCHCFKVSDRVIIKLVKEKLISSVEELKEYTRAGQGCGGCKPHLLKMISEHKTSPYSLLPICDKCKVGPILDGMSFCQICESFDIPENIEFVAESDLLSEEMKEHERSSK